MRHLWSHILLSILVHWVLASTRRVRFISGVLRMHAYASSNALGASSNMLVALLIVTLFDEVTEIGHFLHTYCWSERGWTLLLTYLLVKFNERAYTCIGEERELAHILTHALLKFKKSLHISYTCIGETRELAHFLHVYCWSEKAYIFLTCILVKSKSLEISYMCIAELK